MGVRQPEEDVIRVDNTAPMSGCNGDYDGRVDRWEMTDLNSGYYRLDIMYDVDCSENLRMYLLW